MGSVPPELQYSGPFLGGYLECLISPFPQGDEEEAVA